MSDLPDLKDVLNPSDLVPIIEEERSIKIYSAPVWHDKNAAPKVERSYPYNYRVYTDGSREITEIDYETISVRMIVDNNKLIYIEVKFDHRIILGDKRPGAIAYEQTVEGFDLFYKELFITNLLLKLGFDARPAVINALPERLRNPKNAFTPRKESGRWLNELDGLQAVISINNPNEYTFALSALVKKNERGKISTYEETYTTKLTLTDEQIKISRQSEKTSVRVNIDNLLRRISINQWYWATMTSLKNILKGGKADGNQQ
jgi:hypothetical protein